MSHAWPRSEAPAQSGRAPVWVAMLLAATAGAVDAAGYLTLGRIFMAHMSGNSAAFGAYAGSGNWGDALHRFFPIPLFVLGVVVGAVAARLAWRHADRSPFSAAFGLEALLLVLFLIASPFVVREANAGAGRGVPFHAVAALLPLAMGVQNATLRRAGGGSVRTTFVSGMLTTMAEALAVLLLSRFRPDVTSRDSHRRCLRMVGLCGGLWLCFGSGAAVGGILTGIWGPRAVAVPLCGLLAVIGRDLYRPLGAPRPSRPASGGSEKTE